MTKEINAYVERYIDALRKIVEEKRAEIAATSITPTFPTEYPVKATVFLAQKGCVVYFEKATDYAISIKENERPVKLSQWSEYIPYVDIEAIEIKPEKRANSDVAFLLALSGMLEAHEEEEQAYYEAQELEWMEYDVDSYIEFLKKSNDIVTKTKDASFAEVYNIVKIRRNFLGDYQFLLRVGCVSLDNLYFLIDAELETSIHLALQGRYVSATAGLRKVLEVTMRALFLDCLSNQKEAEKKLTDWVENGEQPVKFNAIINAITPEEVDKELTPLLNKLSIVKVSSFAEALSSMYHDLCAYVHLRPKEKEYDLDLLFPDFTQSLFMNYYNTFVSVVSTYEILLILKFPKILEIEGFNKQTYTALYLSESQCSSLAEFSTSKGILKK